MPEYTVSNGVFQDTYLDVLAGQTIVFSASGIWAPVDPSFGSPGEFSEVGPDGYPNSNQRFSGDSYTNLTDIGSGITNGDLLSQHTQWGALVGFIGRDSSDTPPTVGSYPNGDAVLLDKAQRVFVIGSSLTYTVPYSGRLYIAQNDDAYSAATGDNSGSIQVQITTRIAVRCDDVILAAQTTIASVTDPYRTELRIEFWRNNVIYASWLIAPDFYIGPGLAIIGTIIDTDSSMNLYIPLVGDSTANAHRWVLRFPVSSGVMTVNDLSPWFTAGATECCLAASVDRNDYIYVLVATGSVDINLTTGLKLYKLDQSANILDSWTLVLDYDAPGALAGSDVSSDGRTYYIANFDGATNFTISSYDLTNNATKILIYDRDLSFGFTEGVRTAGSSIYGAYAQNNSKPLFTVNGAQGVALSDTLGAYGISRFRPERFFITRKQYIGSPILGQTQVRVDIVGPGDNTIHQFDTLSYPNFGVFPPIPIVVLCTSTKAKVAQVTLIGAN